MNTTENTRPTLTVIEPIAKISLPTLADLTRAERNDINTITELCHRYAESQKCDTPAYKKLWARANQLIKVEDERAVRNSIVFPHYDAKGRPSARLDNIALLYEREGICPRYNTMSRGLDVSFKGVAMQQDASEHAISAKARDSYITYGIDDKHIKEHIAAIADTNKYHPVRDWMDSIKWDGISRFEEFYAIFTLQPHANVEMCQQHMRRWLLQTVAALYRPDYTLQGILTMQGKQGTRKSSLLKTLTPDQSWVRGDVTISTDNKDSIIEAIKYWIIELGEVDTTFSKSAAGALKQFTAAPVDAVRLPYATRAVPTKRQTSMLASVNDADFLIDDENRRWWIIPVSYVNADHTIDIAQLWAEARHRWVVDRERYWFTAEELKEHKLDNLKYAKGSIITDLLESIGVYKLASDDVIGRLTTTDILLKIGVKNPSKADRIECNKWLTARNFHKHTTGNVWEVGIGEESETLREQFKRKEKPVKTQPKPKPNSEYATQACDESPSNRYIVYKLTVSGLPYIGMTGSPLSQRISGHWSARRKKDTKWHGALAALKSVSEIDAEILSYWPTKAQCEAAEIVAIHQYNSREEGWNTDIGGLGACECAIPVIFTDPNGKQYTPINKSAFCRMHSLPSWGRMIKAPGGIQNNGWTAEIIS